MKHFAIYTNLHKDKEMAVTKKVQTFLHQKGVETTVLVKEPEEEELIKLEKADCMIV